MDMRGNTILITGGGSGIGRGLAEAFHARGNQVVIAGRRREVLEDTVRANPGMASYVVDLQDPSAIRGFAAKVTADFPRLNVLVNNSGIMRAEDLRVQADDLSDMEAIVATNLLGPLRLTAALLPLLQRQARSVVMNVSSGLAFLPLATTPTYCATKAAIHSYTESLRFQLRETSTEVLELIPPYVATDLMNGASDPRAMPLPAYIAEVMHLLETQPEAQEICVENVKRLRFAAETGKYGEVFQGFNEAMVKDPH
ncbi:oxidoreductase [Geothrix rubra]|uniref:Oxidoreductase n=1 Tax=Geothrix rubra TaxID=2927977 RepID=A0ABQ5Q3M2_9BACT|nr:SDR family NAD(P)-dependent oxidoreductase [Geothrix rubra]GLH69340.1 oxidoreductase [Geothrix rubra]